MLRRLKQLVQQWWAGKPRTVRRTLVAFVGTTVLLIGVGLIVLPGPAFLVIPLGLAILATEFVWAQRWLAKARALIAQAKSKAARYRASRRRVHCESSE